MNAVQQVVLTRLIFIPTDDAADQCLHDSTINLYSVRLACFTGWNGDEPGLDQGRYCP